MAMGYAEGPAAEEAERRREELASGVPDAPRSMRLAVEGCTEDEPTHVRGRGSQREADADLRVTLPHGGGHHRVQADGGQGHGRGGEEGDE